MSAGKPFRTLYLCYFGLREPLVQTQVLPYLRQIGRDGVEVILLTFEPTRPDNWTAGERQQWESRLQAEGICWLWLPYHKVPSLPATLWDILAGAWVAAQLVRRERIDVLHARSHPAALMAALARRLSGGRVLFDIRGFAADEYVDAGVWPAGGLCYRLTKQAERWLLREADAFVVLTERAREILFPHRLHPDGGRPVEVIPCCVDLARFHAVDDISREEVRRRLGVSERRVLVYTGTLGGWYLTEEMADFLATAHRVSPTTFSMVLTQSAPEPILKLMKERGVPESDFLVRTVAPEEVPDYLRAADLAISFIKPCYSKLASSPTKLAEYLACGLPVICNAGIGDVDEVIETDRVGVILREFSQAAYLQAIRAAETLQEDPAIHHRCRDSARRRFDLESVGGARYRRLYRRLLTEDAGELAAPAVVQ